MIYQGLKKYAVTGIVIHCTDTRAEWMGNRTVADKVAEIRRWHIEQRGWKDIGYHFIIDRDGAVATGRAMTTVGAHVAGHNSGTIGISLIGGFGGKKTDPFHNHFTGWQDKALRTLIAQISTQTKITMIKGHYQLDARECPCFNVPKWITAK